MPRGRARLEEHLARADRLSLALIATLEELDTDLELDGTLTPAELEEIGRRLASISAAGLRLLEHDIESELSAVVSARRPPP